MKSLGESEILKFFHATHVQKDISPRDKIRKILHFIRESVNLDLMAVYSVHDDATLRLLCTSSKPEIPFKWPHEMPCLGYMAAVLAETLPLVLDHLETHQDTLGLQFLQSHGFIIRGSMLVLPVTKNGKSVGVLWVQSLEDPQPKNRLLDAFVTVSMMMGELLFTDEMTRESPPVDLDHSSAKGLVSLQGHALSPGIIEGHAYLHQSFKTAPNFLSHDTKNEVRRFMKAIDVLQERLAILQKDVDQSGHQESMDILDSFRLFAKDKGWISAILESIQKGFTADTAVLRNLEKIRDRLFASKDPHFRARLWDFRDLSQRLLRILENKEDAKKSFGPRLDPSEEDQNIIVFADAMGPVDFLEYQKLGLKGLVLQQDVSFSHVAILVRSLNIPALCGVPLALSKVQWGDRVALDGHKGHVHLHAPPGFFSHIEDQGSNGSKMAEHALRHIPPITKDGQRINMHLNIGATFDLHHIKDDSVSGIGLFRTEIPFLMEKSIPDVAFQERIYRDVHAQALGRPIVFRTMDVGSDKVLPQHSKRNEENPAMGWRAIRIGLDRPAYLKDQLRALIRASTGRSLSVMFPMIAHVDEFLRAKEIFEKELHREQAKGSQGPEKIFLGAMIETPSIAWDIDELLCHVDFASLGTNDLFQFFYACDRSSRSMVMRYDPLSRPFLTLLHHIAQRAQAHGKTVTVCGEMASQPLEAITALACGFRSLSVNPSALYTIKKMILALDLTQMERFLQDLFQRPQFKIRQELMAFAQDHGVPLFSSNALVHPPI